MATPVAARRTILMYHALRAKAGPVAGQDPRYTIAVERFVAQLDLARRATDQILCTRDLLAMPPCNTVALTFDDGHVSNYTTAYPILVERGLRADFFINPAHVGTSGFVRWDQLREMAAAGMSIQSHGYDHRYFDDLDATALREDLLRSRREIEDRIGRPVILLAPPGGRAPAGLATLARACGYRHVLGSRPGHLGRTSSNRILPRVAITANLEDAQLCGWLDGSLRVSVRAQARHALLGTAKRLLGNRRYERLRAQLLGQPLG